MPTTRHVKIKDVRHVRICGGKDLYCVHPRQGGVWNFGNGELAVIHCHARWPYEEAEPRHGWGGPGYKSRSVWLLQRSTDGGLTWPEENNVVVWDETLPLEERKERVHPAEVVRQQIDMTSPDSILCIARTWLGHLREDQGRMVEAGDPGDTDRSKYAPICVVLRSADRGRTWEQTPTVITGPAGMPLQCNAHPSVLQMSDGSMLMPVRFIGDAVVAAYGSDDDGLSWHYLADIARPTTPTGGISYPGLIRLPDGTVQCYLMEMAARTHSICLCESQDCYNWTAPRAIIRWGSSPWRSKITPELRPPSSTFPTRVLYRSPWPLLLADGRILVLFARRKDPYGIGGIISEDQGQTWSDEFIIRDDGSGTDIGYMLTTQLDDGSVFAAYYFMTDDGQPHGGGRFLAGSTFSV